MIRSSLTHLTNLKGPVPTGLRKNSAWFFKKAVGLMMSAKSMPMLARKGASTRWSLKTTVYLSAGLDGADGVVHLHGDPVLGRTLLFGDLIALALPLDLGLLHHPADGEDHGVGVKLGPVVELDPLAEFEGIGLAVLADGPGLGQPRLQGRGLVLVEDQGLEDVVADHERVAVGLVGPGVQPDRIAAPGRRPGSRP